MQKKLVRPAAVAGMFYPAEADQLQNMLNHMLENVAVAGSAPKAIIAPHAGYVYSGQTAADVYARLNASKERINRVVLLGPAHRMGFHGIAAPTAEAFSTPLGDISLDQDLLNKALSIDGVIELNEAHAQEHSLEVHLPFLQTMLDEFSLAPFVVGDAPTELTANLLETLWGGDETLIVISSDLSHFLDYQSACDKDAATATHIEAYQGEKIGPHDACGYGPVRGLLKIAKAKKLAIERVSLCNSGDTAGDKSRVVGYVSYALH